MSSVIQEANDIMRQLQKLNKELNPVKNALSTLKKREQVKPNPQAAAASLTKIVIRVHDVQKKYKPSMDRMDQLLENEIPKFLMLTPVLAVLKSHPKQLSEDIAKTHKQQSAQETPAAASAPPNRAQPQSEHSSMELPSGSLLDNVCPSHLPYVVPPEYYKHYQDKLLMRVEMVDYLIATGRAGLARHVAVCYGLPLLWFPSLYVEALQVSHGGAASQEAGGEALPPSPLPSSVLSASLAASQRISPRLLPHHGAEANVNGADFATPPRHPPLGAMASPCRGGRSAAGLPDLVSRVVGAAFFLKDEYFDRMVLERLNQTKCFARGAGYYISFPSTSESSMAQTMEPANAGNMTAESTQVASHLNGSSRQPTSRGHVSTLSGFDAPVLADRDSPLNDPVPEDPSLTSTMIEFYNSVVLSQARDIVCNHLRTQSGSIQFDRSMMCVIEELLAGALRNSEQSTVDKEITERNALLSSHGNGAPQLTAKPILMPDELLAAEDVWSSDVMFIKRPTRYYCVRSATCMDGGNDETFPVALPNGIIVSADEVPPSARNYSDGASARRKPGSNFSLPKAHRNPEASRSIKPVKSALSMSLSSALLESNVEGALLHRGSCYILQQAVLAHACCIILALRYLSESGTSASPFAGDDALTSALTDAYPARPLQTQLFGRRRCYSSIMSPDDTDKISDRKGLSTFKGVSIGRAGGPAAACPGAILAPLTYCTDGEALSFPSPARAWQCLGSAPKYAVLTAAHLLRCAAHPYQHCHHEKGALAARVEGFIRQDMAWCATALAWLSKWILRSWGGEQKDATEDASVASLSVESLLHCAVDVSPEVHTVGSINLGIVEAGRGSCHSGRAVFVSELFLQVFPEVGYTALKKTDRSPEEVPAVVTTDVCWDFACGCPHRWMRETLPRWLLEVSLAEHATVWYDSALLKKCFHRWCLRRGFGVLRKLLAGGYNRIASDKGAEVVPSPPDKMAISTCSQYLVESQPEQLPLASTNIKEEDDHTAGNLGAEEATNPREEEEEMKSTVSIVDAPSSIANRSIPSLPSALASQLLTRQPCMLTSAELEGSERAAASFAFTMSVDNASEKEVVRYATEVAKQVSLLKVRDSNDRSCDSDSGLQELPGGAVIGKQGRSAFGNANFEDKVTTNNTAGDSEYEVHIPTPMRFFPENSTPSTIKPSPSAPSNGMSTPRPKTSCRPSNDLVESNCVATSLLGTTTDAPLSYMDAETKKHKQLEMLPSPPPRSSLDLKSLLKSFMKSSSLRRTRRLFLHWRDHRYYIAVSLRYVQALCSEHLRESCFRHWLRRGSAHFRSKKELEDEQRCARVLEAKVHALSCRLVRFWRDAALAARFSMQTVGRRVFHRWRLAVICLKHGRKHGHAAAGFPSNVENRKQGSPLKGLWDRWRERFLLAGASMWYKKREQRKTLFGMLLRARQQRWYRALPLRHDELLKVFVFRKWCDRFEKQTRLNAFSQHYVKRRVHSAFEYWKIQYTLRGAVVKQEAALQKQHECRRLRQDFLFWRKRFQMQQRLHEVNKQCSFGRETLIKIAWDRWTTQTRYRIAWWQGQGEVAEKFHLYAIARRALQHWARRRISRQQALEADVHSRMESRASDHYLLHLSAKAFFKWKVKMFLASKFSVDARRRLPKAALQQLTVTKGAPTDSRRNGFAHQEKHKPAERPNTAIPSVKSVDSACPNSRTLKKATEVGKKKALALAQQPSAAAPSHAGLPLGKRVPKKARANAVQALPCAKKRVPVGPASSALVLRPLPSTVTVSISGEAAVSTRAQPQENTATLGKGTSASPRDQTDPSIFAHATEAFNETSKDAKMFFASPLHKRPLLAERQLLLFACKRKLSVFAFESRFQVSSSQVVHSSSGDAAKPRSPTNNFISRHRSKDLPHPANPPSLSYQKGSCGLHSVSLKRYLPLLRGDVSPRRGGGWSGNGTSGKWNQVEDTPAARVEGLNVSQESPELKTWF